MSKPITVTRSGWQARDYGGPYIELFYGGRGSAADVINVWDYGTNSRAEAHDRQTVDRLLRAWITENGRAVFENVVKYA